MATRSDGPRSQTIVRQVSGGGGDERFCVLHEAPMATANAFVFSCVGGACAVHRLIMAEVCDLLITAGISEPDVYRLLDEATAITASDKRRAVSERGTHRRTRLPRLSAPCRSGSPRTATNLSVYGIGSSPAGELALSSLEEHRDQASDTMLMNRRTRRIADERGRRVRRNVDP
jgi:hypothetical protein